MLHEQKVYASRNFKAQKKISNRLVAAREENDRIEVFSAGKIPLQFQWLITGESERSKSAYMRCMMFALFSRKRQSSTFCEIAVGDCELRNKKI